METTISKLPPEMLVKIFSLLGQKDKASCSRVCRRWEALSNTASLWQEEEAHLDLDRVSFEVLCSVGKRQVGRVLVTSCRRPGSLQKLFLAHPNIRTLDLTPSGMGRSFNIANAFCVPLPHLKTVKIYPSNYATASEFMAAVPKFFPHLERLTLNEVESFEPTRKLCETYSSTLRNLRVLVLRGLFFTDVVIRRLAGAVSSQDGPNPKSRIEHLEIHFGEYLTDEMLNCVSQGFPSLKRLWFYSCSFSDFRGFHFTSRLSELHTLGFPLCSFSQCTISQAEVCSTALLHLTFDRTKAINDGDLAGLVGCFPSLKEVTVPLGVPSSQDIMAMVSKLPQLEKLRVVIFFQPVQRQLAEQGHRVLIETIPSFMRQKIQEYLPLRTHELVRK